jgi:hypothetical protein
LYIQNTLKTEKSNDDAKHLFGIAFMWKMLQWDASTTYFNKDFIPPEQRKAVDSIVAKRFYFMRDVKWTVNLQDKEICIYAERSRGPVGKIGTYLKIIVQILTG